MKCRWHMGRQALTYCALAFIITWTIAFATYCLFKKGELSVYELNLYHALGATGPTVAALCTTYYFYGLQGLNKLLGKLKPRLPKKKVLWVMFSPLLFFVLGLLVQRLIRNRWFDFEGFATENWVSYGAVLFWLLPLVTYAFFEEVGWRGFLLPHLQSKLSAWHSTIYLTGIWALWHLPFFFYRFDFSGPISIGFLFGLFVGAIILTYIYNSSRGVLYPAIVFHLLNNICSGFDKQILVAVLSTGFVFLAVTIYKTYGKLNLSDSERIKNYFIE